jgi:endonuclease/exonuclease/phosphatase family metal-dependent hydrolase
MIITTLLSTIVTRSEYDPPLKPHVIKRLKILTHNVYGVDEDRCEERGKTFGNRVASGGSRNSPPGAYDIIGVQELYEWRWFNFRWVCDEDSLINALKSKGNYKNSDNTKLFTPRANNNINGGIGIFTLHKIIKQGSWQWKNDQQSIYKAAEGFMFTRIKINNADLELDIYNVHVNGTNNRNIRNAQLQQLRTKIEELSKSSGNPVLVMGDFNIGGPLPENNPPGHDGYNDILNILYSPQDLWLNTNYNSPSETGYTTGCGVYSGDANGCNGKERIDYIFSVTHENLTNSPYQIVVTGYDLPSGQRRRGVSRVRWAKTGAFYPPVRYASDHFGVEALIEIRRRPVSLTSLAEKCMTAEHGIAKNGTPVVLKICTGQSRAKWSIHNGEITGIGGYCIDIPGGSTQIGTHLQMYKCNGSKSQRFSFRKNGEIRSLLANNLCIEVKGGFTRDGTAIQTYQCNGTASQKWSKKK